MNLKYIKEHIEPFYVKHKKHTLSYEVAKSDEPYIMGIGANTFIVGDGETTFMIDAYATRDPFRLPIKFSKTEMLFADIQTKRDKVEEVYKAIGCTEISHIVCTHNHFDHTLDLRSFYDCIYDNVGVKPTIVGTLSSVNTALGYDIPKEKTVIIERKKRDYQSYSIGKFKITFLPGKHLKLFALYKSTYQRTPLKRKGFILGYREGGVLDLLIEHENMQPLLVTSSFGIGEYHLKTKVGTMMQAIGGARKVPKKEKIKLFNKNVVESGANKVYLTHYDNFFKDFNEGLHYVNVNSTIVDLFRSVAPDKEIGLIKYFEKIKL